jgi:hypothetical protein
MIIPSPGRVGRGEFIFKASKSLPATAHSIAPLPKEGLKIPIVEMFKTSVVTFKR